ncbi:glutathione S-transferase N-terminal domain-containing protein [Zobellella maritima]|uniref:glutathione S-transferase N-terminal domain-containing protein n=1 Tax=Zobellella maritima TaxID=2059725 RepID=UPI001300888C|nr:glutathione S-transferase N-terminal domain-containing protein [Zobellella maritima]
MARYFSYPVLAVWKCSCSSAAHICLLEAGLDFTLIKVNLGGDRRLPDGRHLNDINPKGYVPGLELDNGKVLTENVAILQYIAAQKPEIGLAPANGALARYRLLEWLGFIDSEVHKTLGLLFNPRLAEIAKPARLEKLGQRAVYLDLQLVDAYL